MNNTALLLRADYLTVFAEVAFARAEVAFAEELFAFFTELVFFAPQADIPEALDVVALAAREVVAFALDVALL